jgi:hypothetical protein
LYPLVRMSSMTRRFCGVVVVALAVALPAAAKEGAQAHLLAPVPVHAVPGQVISIRWTVDVPGAKGTRVPFSAIGMFVRLLGTNGAFTNATAPQLEGPPYTVRIRVPRGGVRHIRFGLMGRSCGPSGCSPSPAYFPLR